MKKLAAGLFLTMIAVSILGSGCSLTNQSEHYVSPEIQGVSQRINLDEVKKAFWESKGKDLNSWMSAFEKRVNEIYEGKEIVSLDATRQKDRLIVTGYINTLKKEGYQPGDDKLFSIEQTGEAANNEMPYRVAGEDGRPYYEGSHSILDNPFLQMMLVSHLMGGWGGGYSTPFNQLGVLQGYRDNYRMSPQWNYQQTANRQFETRFKTKALGGGLQSRSGFGSGMSSAPSASSRTWGGLTKPSAPSASPSSSVWGGRRSPSFGGRSWGGRRR